MWDIFEDLLMRKIKSKCEELAKAVISCMGYGSAHGFLLLKAAFFSWDWSLILTCLLQRPQSPSSC